MLYIYILSAVVLFFIIYIWIIFFFIKKERNGQLSDELTRIFDGIRRRQIRRGVCGVMQIPWASSKRGAAAGPAKKPEITDGAPRWCRRSPRKKNIFVSFHAANARPTRLAAVAALNFLNNYRGYELDSSPKFAFLRCFICASQSQRN